jgi:cysteine-rich repeat protein
MSPISRKAALTRVVAVGVVVGGVVANAAAPVGMNDAGVRAAEERRYCDASAIFVQVHGLSQDPLALYRGAETAFAANDLIAAIRLYRTLLDNHPDFDRRAIVEARVAELLLRVRDVGPGTACTLPPRICGDWIVSAGEGCDDGNIIDGDGCDATCMPTGCGNGVVTFPEVCDDGNLENGDGCDNNCTVSRCGNGAVAAGEVCDDGNTVDGDGCDSNCTISACGNGVRASGEACDDGNLENGDGCDSACMVEAPTRPFPVVPVVAGGALVAAGVAIAIIGTLPLSAHAQAQQDIAAAEDLGPANPQAAIERAQDAQRIQEQAQADWSSWGITAVVGGALAAVGGLVVVVSAFLWPEGPPADDGAATTETSSSTKEAKNTAAKRVTETAP